MIEVIETKIGKLTIRPFQLSDIEAQMKYLYDNDNDFLESLGFDPKSFPGKEKHSELMRNRLQKNMALPESDRQHFAVVAEVDQRPIAMAVLKTDEGNDTAHAHFHIWEKPLRGQGLGEPILKTGVKLLMKHQCRTTAWIEPRDSNLAMNRLMEKCGFKFLTNCVFSSPITQSFSAKRYEIKFNNL